MTAAAAKPLHAVKSLWRQPWMRRALAIALLVLVIALLARQAQQIEWQQVGASLRSYRGSVLASALALAATAYLIYTAFDVLAQRYIDVKLPTLSVMRTGFISYAFNQSLGALIGAVAFRLRLYSRLGLNPGQISTLIFFSVWTNWLGYAALAGGIFGMGWVNTPESWDAKWKVGEQVLQGVGIGLICLVIAYMTLCVLRPGHEFKWRKHRIVIPTARLASLQLLLGMIHWPTVAAVMYCLLGGQVEFVTVLGALLFASVASAMAHIPAGLGVLETVFIGLLRHKLPVTEIVAAILAYRAIYQLLPLSVAAGIYLTTELRGENPKKKSRSNRS